MSVLQTFSFTIISKNSLSNNLFQLSFNTILYNVSQNIFQSLNLSYQPRLAISPTLSGCKGNNYLINLPKKFDNFFCWLTIDSFIPLPIFNIFYSFLTTSPSFRSAKVQTSLKFATIDINNILTLF